MTVIKDPEKNERYTIFRNCRVDISAEKLCYMTGGCCRMLDLVLASLLIKLSVLLAALIFLAAGL